MEPTESEAVVRLKSESLRDFGIPHGEQTTTTPGLPTYILRIDDAPVPELYRYALELVGCRPYGPGEKFRWRVDFTYQGERAQLAFEKFGLRLYLKTDRPERMARETQLEISKKLKSSMRLVESVVREPTPDLLSKGLVTVRNQHIPLLRAYQYFRDRTINQQLIEDEFSYQEYPPGSIVTAIGSFTNGRVEMSRNSFHDLVAAITAYLSLLEHDMVLALAFCEFDPDQDDLLKFIGHRWGQKWDRILGQVGQAALYRQRLTDIVETWRNPYSHGGFAKGGGATVFLHTPGVDAALPIGLTRVADSPLYSFFPDTASTATQVFSFFDELDTWIGASVPEAAAWIASGLDVRYDNGFRAAVIDAAAEEGGFARLLTASQHAQEQWDNMDF